MIHTHTTNGLKHLRTLLLVTWLILAMPLSASAQEVAGRVISTVGEVIALRPEDSERILGRGDEVYVGDRLKTAENGRAQIRFIDEGLVDLRPDSAFEVVEYREADDQESGSAAMEFTAGALRTITGRIGNRPDDDYQLETTAASIGIRGTDYSLQLCDFDCAENNQQEGLYGRVDDGIVAVTNQAGTTEFSQNQYFLVESDDMMPQLLTTPPQNILDGNEDGETAEDDTDNGDNGEDPEPVQVAEPDDDTDDTPTDDAVTVETAFLAAEADPVTEDDLETGPEPVTRVMAGSYQYSNTFFGGLIREGEGYDGSFQIVENDGGRPFLDSANFSDGWGVSTDHDSVLIEEFDDRTLSDGSTVYWGTWYSTGLLVSDPNDEPVNTTEGEFFHIFSEDVTTPEQISDMTGTVNYTAGPAGSSFVESSGLQDWNIDDISMELNFSNMEVSQFDINMSDGPEYKINASASDSTIENLLLLDFALEGTWEEYTYDGVSDHDLDGVSDYDLDGDGDISGNFSGQLIGESADGMIFSIDMERLNEEGVSIEDLIASGLLEADR